jgi:hypothetical protein
MLTQPYVTPAMFEAFPTWLDLDNLVPGGMASVQTDVLADALLAASDWAVGVCDEMPLHAHWVQNEDQRARSKGSGRVYVRPKHIPLRAITSMSWGSDPSSMTAVSLPDPTMWFEDGRRVSWRPGGGITQFSGPALEFGPRPGPARQVYVTWSYIPGFPVTTFASAVAEGASSVEVTDPTGILPGDVLRVFDPGVTEALTVASTYAPSVPAVPPAPTVIPLAANAANAHAEGTGITEMPRKMMQAVIAYGVSLLMRDDVSEEAPASPFGPAARTTENGRGGQASGIINDAYGWLAPYRPTLR